MTAESGLGLGDVQRVVHRGAVGSRSTARPYVGAMTQGAIFRRLVVAPSRNSTSSRYETA